MLKLFDFIVVSNLWISTMVGLFTVEGYLIYHLPINFAVVAIAFFGTLCIYNLQRIARIKETSILRTVKTLLLQMDVRMIGAVIGAFGCSITILFLSMQHIVFLAIGGIIAVLYGVPIAFGKKGLRGFPLGKVFFIAGSYAFITAVLPILPQSNYLIIPSHVNFYFFLSQFYYISAITIPFDIKDLHTDKKDGILTIPIAIGVRGAKIAAMIFMLVSAGLWFPQSVLGGPYTWIAAMLITVLTVAGIGFSAPNKSKLYCAYILEGTMVVHFAFVYLLCNQL